MPRPRRRLPHCMANNMASGELTVNEARSAARIVRVAAVVVGADMADGGGGIRAAAAVEAAAADDVTQERPFTPA